MKISEIVEKSPSQKFIEDFGYNIFRGLDHGIKDGELLYPLKKRKPVDTLLAAHNYANMLSKEKLGVEIRNLVFASNDSDIAGNYGEIFSIVPAEGNYRIFTNKNIADFTSYLDLFVGDITRLIRIEISVECDKFKVNKENNDRIHSLRAMLTTIFTGDSIESFDEILNKSKKLTTETFDDKHISKVIIDVIGEHIEKMKKDITNYVDNIEDITNKGLPDMGSKLNINELMIYAPNGYFVYEREG